MENAIFDIKEALSRIDNDRELFKELVGMFLENCPIQLARARSAITQKDRKLLESAAHDIKSSLGIFCAKPAFEMAQKLEIMGRENNLINVKEAYKMLEKEIEHLKPELEIIINEANS